MYRNSRNGFILLALQWAFSSAFDGVVPVNQQQPLTNELFEASDTFQELVRMKENEVFTGEMGDRCDENNEEKMCREGLKCAGPPFFKTCQALDCYEAAVQKVFVGEYDMETFTQRILREAGLGAMDDYYEKGEGWFGFVGNKIRPEVETAVLGALMANPLPLDEFQQELKNSCGNVDEHDEGAIKAKQATEEGSTVYGGVIFKTSFGLRFSNAYFFANGIADEAGGWYTDICTGGGFEAGAKVAGIIGTVYSGTKKDIIGTSCGYSFDITPFIGYGIYVGFGVPNGVTRVNSELGGGFLLGVGGVFCQTIQLADLTPPTTSAPTPAPTISNHPSGAPSMSSAPSTSSPPTNVPSSSPSSSPTICPAACFSEDNTVYVEGVGEVPVKELRVGDRVLAANGKYQPIYAQGHVQSNKDPADFLVIQTNARFLPPLEITPDHLVYLQNKPNEPIRAANVQVGDILMHHYQGNNTMAQKIPVVVTSISSVEKHGVFLPMTIDGTLVVNGLEASVYAAMPQVEEFMSWLEPVMSMHTLVHWYTSPLRMLCTGSPSATACQSYSDDGLLVWFDWGIRICDYLNQFNTLLKQFLLLAALCLLGCVRLVEVILGPTFGYAFLLSVFPLALARRVSSSRK